MEALESLRSALEQIRIVAAAIELHVARWKHGNGYPGKSELFPKETLDEIAEIHRERKAPEPYFPEELYPQFWEQHDNARGAYQALSKPTKARLGDEWWRAANRTLNRLSERYSGTRQNDGPGFMLNALNPVNSAPIAELLKAIKAAEREVEDLLTADIAGGFDSCLKEPRKLPEIPATIGAIRTKIKHLRQEWLRPEELRTYSPQESLEATYAGLIFLGYKPPVCPTLLSTSFIERVNGNGDPGPAWREYHAWLNAAESCLGEDSPAATATPGGGHGGTGADSSAMQRVLSIYTSGVMDEKANQAAVILNDTALTVSEKLARIDKLIPIPPTNSAAMLGKALGVERQAVIKTKWWTQNRRGEQTNLTGRRQAVHDKRIKQNPYKKANDDEDE